MHVRYTGTVTSEPTFFSSRRSHNTHEQFDVRADDGTAFRVVDNVTIAPRVAVRPGDRVTVQGDLIRPHGFPPIVHWTHRDPRHHHADGFITAGGRTYA